MTEIKHDNGVVTLIDDRIQPGDIIAAYRGGYHEVLRVVAREKYAPLVTYRTICTETGKRVNGKAEHTCDMAYCRLAVDVLPKEIEKLEQELAALKEFLAGLPKA